MRFSLRMTDGVQHTVIRRVRLRKDLKPIPCLGDPMAAESDWLAIAQVTDSKGFESFDLVFLDSDGAVFPYMGFETLRIAKARAQAMVGVEYLEWEHCQVEITNADHSISWERALPGAEQARG